MSRSDYYYEEKKQESEETAVEKAVINCFKKHKRNYGRKRIKKALAKKKIKISENKIRKILKKHNLIAKNGVKPSRKPEKPSEEKYTEDNMIKDKFSITTPNYLWCSDNCELKYKYGKLYICGIIDVATRRIVGWSIARYQTQELVQKAFVMAIGRNPQIPEGAIYHSDRGTQFTAKKTKEIIEKNGFRKSMSRPGTPHDNQPIESFWKTLKNEIDDLKGLNYKEAYLKIVEYIELYYNAERLHSGINYNIPNEYFFTVSCVQKS